MIAIGKKSLLYLGLVAVTLPLGLTCNSGWATRAVAAPQAKASNNSRQIAQAFQPPPGGRNASTAGGATRSPYSDKKKSLVALIPQSNLGLTLAERPTFFLYVGKTTAKEIILTVVDVDTKEVFYETKFAPPAQPGIVNVSLPASAKSLEVGKRYEWTFQEENSSDREEYSSESTLVDKSGSAFVQGYVERIEPSQELMAELAVAGDRDRARVYAKHGIWHETVINSAKERSSNQADWEALLNSVDLGAIAKEPLVECCGAEISSPDEILENERPPRSL